MFTFTTVRTLIESQLAADHPLRRIRAHATETLDRLPAPKKVAIQKSDEKPPEIPRPAILRALTWRALYTLRNETLLREALRFDLRCQWFVGFCLEERDWTHAMFDKAMRFYLAEPSTATFFEALEAFLAAEGLLEAQCFAIDGELLHAWADPSSILAGDALDAAPRATEKKAWRNFKGRRRSKDAAAIPAPAEAWCLPGYRPGNVDKTVQSFDNISRALRGSDDAEADRWAALSRAVKRAKPLDGSLRTVRALANAQLGPLSARATDAVAAPTPATPPARTGKTDKSYDPKSLMESLFEELTGRK